MEILMLILGYVVLFVAGGFVGTSVLSCGDGKDRIKALGYLLIGIGLMVLGFWMVMIFS